MSWITKIQAQPRAKKIRTIWTITLVALLVLLGVWVVVGNYNSGARGDLSLFKAFGKGLSDLSKQSFKPSVENNTITPAPLPQTNN